MDSIRIYNRSHWYRWSRQFDKGNNGGSQIDFLWCLWNECKRGCVLALDFAGYRRIENPCKAATCSSGIAEAGRGEKKAICPTAGTVREIFLSYFISESGERGISRTVRSVLKDGLIYESRHYHNVVFKRNDKNGRQDLQVCVECLISRGKPFKCDVTGNDKNYGFCGKW